MEKLVLISKSLIKWALCTSAIWIVPLFSQAQVVEVLGSQKFSSADTFKTHRVGGLSGLSYSGGFLWSISDDRGMHGPPRFYKMDFQSQKVKSEDEVLVKEPADSPVVDFEALNRLNSGEFLISSEGDFNKKPRVFPFVRFWSTTRGWGKSLPLPSDFFPEKIGLQTRGLHNNSAFEGVTISLDEKTIYLMSELPLVQNKKDEIEFLEYGQSDEGEWRLQSRKPYVRDLPPENTIEVMRGISEILYWKSHQLLVLERYVRVDRSKGFNFGAELFSVTLPDLKKKKIFTFENKWAGNWEGMTWGPDLSDGRKQLILVTDNNFEKGTPTQFLFLAVKEESK